MAFVFVKFPKKFLDTEEWRKPRKYSKAEALIHLLSVQEIPPIRELAKQWQWSKSTVADFIANAKDLGYLGQISDKSRTQCTMSNSELRDSVGQISDKSRTHLIRDKDTPPILSTTNVVSNIFPPKGESESANPDFIEFQRWIEENAPRVAKMKEPFTEAQFFALRTDFDAQFSCDLLKSMHNYEPLLTKNRSANLTFRNWAKRRKQDDTKRTTNTPSNDPKSRLEGVLRAAAEGISRANTSQEWESRAVGL